MLVAEVGASPLEPVNGTVAVEELGSNVKCTVLSTHDPYAVTGLIGAYGDRPDLVTGLATSTQAGVKLVEQISNVEALNAVDRDSLPELRDILKDALGV